jgi:hypothetical protein
MLTKRSYVEECRHCVEPTVIIRILDASLRLTAVQARGTRRLSFLVACSVDGLGRRGIAILGWLKGVEVEVEAMAVMWCSVNHLPVTKVDKAAGLSTT